MTAKKTTKMPEYAARMVYRLTLDAYRDAGTGYTAVAQSEWAADAHERVAAIVARGVEVGRRDMYMALVLNTAECDGDTYFELLGYRDECDRAAAAIEAAIPAGFGRQASYVTLSRSAAPTGRVTPVGQLKSTRMGAEVYRSVFAGGAVVEANDRRN